MRYFVRRRLLGSSLTVMVILLLLTLSWLAAMNLGFSGSASGWSLLGLIVFLALYNLRKAIPYLPLGSSASWLQLHIYCGLTTLAVFLVHTRFALPRGAFECLLAAVYLLVFASGVFGLFISRSFPARLTMLGDEVIFEDIPVIRRQLQQDIEALVLRSNTDARTSTIANIYRQEVCPYILKHHDLLSHLTRGTSARWHRLCRTLDDQKRYLNEEECQVLDEVRRLAGRKHQLDTQYALQGLLKLWLFLHVPLTWALLIFAAFHVVLVHAWSGGLS